MKHRHGGSLFLYKMGKERFLVSVSLVGFFGLVWVCLFVFCFLSNSTPVVGSYSQPRDQQLFPLPTEPARHRQDFSQSKETKSQLKLAYT